MHLVDAPPHPLGSLRAPVNSAALRRIAVAEFATLRQQFAWWFDPRGVTIEWAIRTLRGGKTGPLCKGGALKPFVLRGSLSPLFLLCLTFGSADSVDNRAA